MGEAIGGEAVDDAEDVAELVVEARARPPRSAACAGCRRPSCARRTSGPATSRRRHVAAQIDEDRGDPGTSVAGQVVEAGNFLEAALDALGDLEDRVLEGRAGPGRLHDHRAEGEGRVLVAAEAEERQGAGEDGGDHEVDDQRAALDRPLGKIGADHCGSPSRRTCCPGRSAWTPAVTTTSPGSSPCATTTRAGS